MDDISTDELETRVRRCFDKACTRYHLLEDGDRILIALSGGKDSLELTRLLAMRARIYRPRIQVEAVHVVMDNIPYMTGENYLKDFCERLGVRLHILHACFDETKDQRKTKCFLCSWTRRKTLFNYAQKNNFNKIALGHHKDDFLVTLLLNMNYEGALSSMCPSLRMTHYPITLIRPMCMVNESDVKELSMRLGFQSLKKKCPYEEATKREAMGRLLRQMESINPEARSSMWHALEKTFGDNTEK